MSCTQSASAPPPPPCASGSALSPPPPPASRLAPPPQPRLPAAPPPPSPSSGALFGSVNASTARYTRYIGTPMSAPMAMACFSSMKVAPEVPKSKVHSLVELQTFEGNWTWEQELFNILGSDMEAMHTKISNMFQNDGKVYLLSDRENDMIATLLAMGWLTRDQNDSKDVWELVFEKADSWVKNELGEMKSELFNDYGTDVWMSLQ
ncbi:uncharacterized protein N7483_000087 [Penicillium malachiteum]|uniref:uncharacterized protein n=1 Tax=Penicillium malachiteum TaxID=1324776 RepID=UPI00254777B7|nr:uncharacterized protein N7483_000087 [Penicillium malachiteum]KAJ5734962.1 hypothetical protein N7483_000087 [Penicillium malachiteum]